MKRLLLLVLLALGEAVGYAQLSSPINSPIFRAFDSNGQPLAGGKLYSYIAGSSTPQSTYADAQRTTPNANPVILDSTGQAKVFLGLIAYKFILQDANGVQQWSIDYVNGAPPTPLVSSVFGRTGNILAASGDYTCGQITGAVCSLPTLRYQTVMNNTTTLTQRSNLNFLSGTNVTASCVDNSGNDSTDCTFDYTPPTNSDIWFSFNTCTIAQTGNLYSCNSTFSGSPFPLTGSFLMVCSATTPGPVGGAFNIINNSLTTSGFSYNWMQVMGNGTSGAAVGATVTCHIHFP